MVQKHGSMWGGVLVLSHDIPLCCHPGLGVQRTESRNTEGFVRR